MHLVTVINAHTGEAEEHACYHVEMGGNLLGFPMEGAKQVHIYNNILGRADACICIETFEPVKIEPFWMKRPNGY